MVTRGRGCEGGEKYEGGQKGKESGMDPALLWLWCRLEATAPIRPLAWEPPCAAGAAQEIAKRQKKKKKKKKKNTPCACRQFIQNMQILSYCLKNALSELNALCLHNMGCSLYFV